MGLWVFGAAAFVVAAFVLWTGLGLVRLADQLSRRYRGRPPRWDDLWTDVEDSPNAEADHR